MRKGIQYEVIKEEEVLKRLYILQSKCNPSYLLETIEMAISVIQKLQNITRLNAEKIFLMQKEINELKERR